MWSPLVFCLIVGFALGSNTPAWKENKEYVYKIQGRSLSGLEIANEFSGILLKASLRVQTRPDGKLQCLIVNPQYAQIHSELSDGWMTYIPDHEVSWKPLEMTRKPFQVEINHGVITDVILNKGVPHWESNMIRGMMSQFQMNLNKADSHMTQNDNRQDSAFFKVYEETVSGNTETIYEINPIPEYKLFNSEVPRLQKLEEDDDQILEVVKHKNYTENIELPSYFYGFGDLKNEHPATSTMGKLFLRNTLTRAFVTGNLKQFTIQHSLTINEIVVSPTLADKQRGAVYTLWNTTLQQVKPQEQLLEDLASPIRLGGLIYAYANPLAKTNEALERNSNRNQIPYNRPAMHRLSPNLYSEHEASEYKQDQPQINEAPQFPFFAYSIGNKGLSIKSEIDIVMSVTKIAKEIGHDVQDPRATLHEQVFEKFITLTSLVRNMDESELRQASKKLYTTTENREEYAAWTSFRDAVTESGHGPALLLIQSWIEMKNVQDQEAAHIISTMAKRVEHPTTPYMKTFFELIKKPVVISNWPLNETAILSYSDLVRKVYFDKDYFENQFPVNAFENLKDKEGFRFIKDTVIPYFAQRLDKAIIQAETNKIHTYIRALGYTGSPDILKAYEPYLEGKKHCSQFQRTLMIVSLKKLVETFPEVAGPVLFRTYKNSGETSEVRVAAVFQLFRTNPRAEMLQEMASYTRIDTDEQVNAAVKSSIQTAARFDNHLDKLCKAAEMAEPLLTEKEYGIHQGGNFLKNYVIEELDQHYKQTVQLWSSDWYYVPNGFRYAVKSQRGGFRKQIVDVEGLVTSVGQLINIAEKQTESYQQEKQEKQNSDESQKYPWSSQNIAKMLNMKSDVREQLEGNILMSLNGPFKMLSFDNRTFERLPELIRKFEDKLRNGQDLDVVKFLNNDHVSLAVPNELGLPFVFTYNAPMFMKLHGKVRAASNPQLSQNGRIQTPERLQAKVNVSITFGAKVTGHISFITPFDNQQYLSGFDKIWQAHVPVISNMEIDVKNNEVEIEIQPEEIHTGAHLFHYSTWPFTARKNIMNLNTINAQKHKQIIKPQGLRRFERIFGKKETGLAFQVELEHDRNTMDISDVRFFCKHGILNGLDQIWNDEQIQYSHLNVTYMPEESSTNKVVLRLGYQQEYKKQGNEETINWQQVSKADKSESRQQTLMRGASSGIKNVQTHAMDASVEFQGQKDLQYILSGAYSVSHVDAKSRAYAFFKKDGQNDKPTEVKFEMINNAPNTNSLNLQDILRSEPKVHSEIKIRFDTENGESKIKADIKMTRSEERKEYLTEQPMYHQCVHDGRVGNKQSPACVNMTIEANYLDRVDMDIKSENINPAVQNFMDMVYGHLQYQNYPNLKLKERSSVPKNQMKFQAHFDRDLKFVNVSINTHQQQVTFRDIELNEYAKRIFVVHPAVHVSTRALSKALEIDTLLDTCVVDRSQVTTFTNWTYPADISKHWTVVAQFVPKSKVSVEQQLSKQLTNYVILVRENQENKNGKDFKLVLSAPETKFKVIDITLVSSKKDSVKAAVKVNENRIEVSDTESYDIEDGYVQIYANPNGEVKISVGGQFIVIYDGERAKIGSINGFFRDSTRGMCGQFNDQQTEDHLTSNNCFVRNPEKLIRSYEVEGPEGKQVRQELERDSKKCLKRTTPIYINLIEKRSFKILGESEDQQDDDCTGFRTQYVEQNNEICFTIYPVPSCKRMCEAQGYISKTVSAHCIPNSNVAELWKQQIIRGASPDFSHKSENRKVQVEVPISCSA